MKQIAMNKVNKENILEMLIPEAESKLVIPEVVEIVDINTGSIEGKDNNLFYWANFDVVSVAELDALKSVGLEENANVIKLKLGGYNNENLNNWVGLRLDTSKMNLALLEKKSNRGSDITGIAFKSDLSDLVEA